MRAFACLLLAACGRVGFDPLDGDVQVAVGGEVSCARVNGRVACWGRNDEGQLGRGSLVADPTVAWVPGLDHIIDMYIASDTQFAVDDSGAVWSWGHAGEHALGVVQSEPRAIPDRTPVLSDIVAVRGGSGICAIASSGVVTCWGDADAGQLAIGSAPDNTLPTTSVIANVDQLSIGTDHACSVTGDQLSCWGCDQADQLGVDRATMVDTCTANDNSLVPCALAPLALPDLAVRSVSAGRTHTCAILSDDRIHCWGSNTSGQLGNGLNTDSVAPVTALDLTGATQVGAAREHTCAVLADGSAWCWGEGSSNGRLGNDMFVDFNRPVRVVVPVALTSIAVEQSANHTCAIAGDGSIWCWGRNDFGQLGSSAGTDSARPLRVELPP